MTKISEKGTFSYPKPSNGIFHNYKEKKTNMQCPQTPGRQNFYGSISKG
jgi:hypothetical protein